MPSYKEFAQKARERYLEKQKKRASGVGQYQFTMHAQYKMRQYGLSEQRVKRVLHAPRRTEEGIAPKTTAVMQPVSVKRGKDGKEIWTQEIWVMYVAKNQELGIKNQEQKKKDMSQSKTHNSQFLIHNSANRKVRIISAWRYPGISPKRHPIPEEILRELEEGSILEADE